MKPIEKTIGAYFREFAADWVTRQFLFDEERSFSVLQAYNTALSVANQLYSCGVRCGSPVALRCTRSLDTGLIYLALQLLGAVALLTDPHQRVESFLADAGVQAAFCITNENSSTDISANGGWEILGIAPLKIDCTCASCTALFPDPADVYTPATVIFTSGSTGKSKGVMLSQYNLVNHIRNFSVSGCYREEDVSIELLPLHHAFGLAVLLMGLIKRYTIFFPQQIGIPYVADCIEKHHITRLDGVPTFALALAERHRDIPFQADSLRVGVLGGAPSTKAQFDFIEEQLGIKLLPVYGQSECIGITGADETRTAEQRASSVGTFLPMNEGVILDASGNEVPPGEIGEICVKSPAVMLGYLGDAQATRETIDENGRLHTGDLGYLDMEGNLHISGRKKDIIIRNGNNISARKIEEALYAISGVSAAAVVGVPHAAFGEVPCALVVCRQDLCLSEQELRSQLNSFLQKNEMPTQIRFAPSLPLTSSGKPDKQRIKKMFAE